MTQRLLVLLVVALVTMQCAKRTASLDRPLPNPTTTPVPANEPVEVTGLSKDQLRPYIGQKVTVSGKFSLYGVIGPFIKWDNGVIYLKLKENYSWGKEFDRLEGRQVRATATLGFEHLEPSPRQHPPDYFYFPTETPITLVK